MNTTKRSPALRWVLGGSIALNLALLLVFLAPLLGWHPGVFGHRPMGPLAMPGPRELHESLSAQRHDLIEQVLERHRPDIRERMQATRLARRQLDRLLRQDPLSAAELDAGFAELRLSEANAATAVHGMLAELLLQLQPDERRQVADHMAHRLLHQVQHARAAAESGQADTPPGGSR